MSFSFTLQTSKDKSWWHHAYMTITSSRNIKQRQ